jgi:hypothetical protein
MNTKLTLRMDETAIRRAKEEARRLGKSVSQRMEDFVVLLGKTKQPQRLPPVTASLVGIIKNRNISEDDYKKHLRTGITHG